MQPAAINAMGKVLSLMLASKASTGSTAQRGPAPFSLRRAIHMATAPPASIPAGTSP